MIWAERMAQAEKRFKSKQPAFTTDDKKQAILWTTCLFSEMDPRIPRKDHGGPYDFELSMDGAYFMSQVGADQYEQAKTTYDRMLKREAKLLGIIEANE